MKLFVIHQCENTWHSIPLVCACYAVSRDNASFTIFCDNTPVIDAMPVQSTEYHVLFSSGMGKSYLDVTRLKDSDREEINNRE